MPYYDDEGGAMNASYIKVLKKAWKAHKKEHPKNTMSWQSFMKSFSKTDEAKKHRGKSTAEEKKRNKKAGKKAISKNPWLQFLKRHKSERGKTESYSDFLKRMSVDYNE